MLSTSSKFSRYNFDLVALRPMDDSVSPKLEQRTDDI